MPRPARYNLCSSCVCLQIRLRRRLGPVPVSPCTQQLDMRDRQPRSTTHQATIESRHVLEPRVPRAACASSRVPQRPAFIALRFWCLHTAIILVHGGVDMKSRKQACPFLEPASIEEDLLRHRPQAATQPLSDALGSYSLWHFLRLRATNLSHYNDHAVRDSPRCILPTASGRPRLYVDRHANCGRYGCTNALIDLNSF